MSFVYYIPGARQNDVKKNAQKSGILDYALEWDADEDSTSDVTIFANGTNRGPDGSSGGLLHQGDGVPYDLETQKWVKHPNEDYWIGYDPDNPPGPADLERRDVFCAYEVPMGDGKRWKLPTAIGRDKDWCPLPKYREIEPDTGKIKSRPLPRFDDLRLYAAEIREAMLRDNAEQIHVEREAEVCVEALQTNYRVGILECSELRLITDDAVTRIFMSLINYPEWPEVEQEIARQATTGGEQ